EAKVFKHAMRTDEALERALSVHDSLICEVADGTAAIERSLAPAEEVLVRARGADSVETASEPADRRRVGAAVVVDDNHHSVIAVGERVQRFPRHASRERAVSDHRDSGAIDLALERVAAGDSGGPR